ncbi:macrolide-specific efflux protein macA, partial [Yersinia pestis PY-11]
MACRHCGIAYRWVFYRQASDGT